jgi:sRNA-binding protein
VHDTHTDPAGPAQGTIALTKKEAKRAAQRRTIDAALLLLAERWPQTFFIHEAKRRPLKIGIRTDIAVALDGAITGAKISATLNAYVHNAAYLRRCWRAGTPRIGLDGQPAGQVTEIEATYAQITLHEQTVAAIRRRSMPPSMRAEMDRQFEAAAKRKGSAA